MSVMGYPLVRFISEFLTLMFILCILFLNTKKSMTIKKEPLRLIFQEYTVFLKVCLRMLMGWWPEYLAFEFNSILV